MTFEFERLTVATEVVFEGVGIHSGLLARAVVKEGCSGIAFNGVRATPENVGETTRSTTLGSVRMVEHLMSALAATGITDAEVSLEGDEMPILDGGSLNYYEGLLGAGVRAIGASRGRVFGRVHLQEGAQRIAISAGTGRWRYEFEREGHWPGKQVFEGDVAADYASEIAPAKTLAFEDELTMLRAAGLGKGGTPENTLVIGSEGYLTENRFPDEPPRHKLLDCIGDLYLSGVPPRFLNVVAEKSGHKMNVEAARRLAEICAWEG
jgi:UDP-3-O-[3-hydroxymyristoyl] N-acetylglucosamine deacetylase